MFYLFFQAQQITQQQSQQVHQLTEENVSIHSHQSVDEHYEEMLQYAETHKMYEEQRSTQRSILMSFPPVKNYDNNHLDYQIVVRLGSMINVTFSHEYSKQNFYYWSKGLI